jgi:hypothetical protein
MGTTVRPDGPGHPDDSCLAFSMIGTIAFDVVAILDAQDDQIAALQ